LNAPDNFPTPVIDALNAPYWDALGQGHLSYQHCKTCSNSWLPARSECPGCLDTNWCWQTASGDARLVSWVVYHRAFDPAFQERLPYNVAIVELDEGPRLISNIVGLDTKKDIGSQLRIDQPLQLAIRHEHGVAIPAFVIKAVQ